MQTSVAFHFFKSGWRIGKFAKQLELVFSHPTVLIFLSLTIVSDNFS